VYAYLINPAHGMSNIRVDARQPDTTLDPPGSDPRLQGDGEQYMPTVVIARTERCTVGSSPTGCMPSLGGVPLTMRPLDNASLGLQVADRCVPTLWDRMT
jgi:hypothetical protein